uniref:Uncharacterized protein n=2 Tax=Timema TaxID=61471 RepID=A0A7R9E1D1_9NEOP|nr:unnamed protein product [Timema cristinae]CAD7425636.1 unnamed protein product [Timema monikensis]
MLSYHLWAVQGTPLARPARSGTEFVPLYRNRVNVEGATHKQVVDLIKSGGDVLTLTVISVTQQVTTSLHSM